MPLTSAKDGKKARGCRIEHEAACAYGLTVIYEDGYNILNEAEGGLKDGEY